VRPSLRLPAEQGQRREPPGLRDVFAFTDQVLAQRNPLKNWNETETFKFQVYLLPMELDEKAAWFRLPALGAERSEP